ncbi:protein abrupt-like isoform X2 [Macrosteles quadrilineatus]|uniref:protein abrupt-like isoform X2 n=1 Tax=Macrosteles quadrilineatus TaxID=74068 RepID=UPI0023E1DECC|nr:protein abrupt-like isoform X2 [Macrosteles quadrilineatus]XP_054289841.1 protein abrupt-like isoform X2 [Macrosteles quadrilineatus]
MLSHYVVHWAGYQAHLQSACCDQFLSEKFVDVTLAVDAGLIKCHRVILSAASGYFHQLLSQHDSSHPIIFMRDMQYWELIALVDFMYRGEVTVEADRLEQLMWSASQLQIHGLAACLKACLQRNSNASEQEMPSSIDETQQMVTEAELEEDSQESNDLGDTGIPHSLSKLCELNCELELRPITPSTSSNSAPSTSGSGVGSKGKKRSLPLPPLHALSTETVPVSQKNVVKEEIEFFEEKPPLSPTGLDTPIQIQEESATSTAPADMKKSNQTIRQFLLLNPMQGHLQDVNNQRNDYSKMSLHDPPLYKRYSPSVLEQALLDLKTGRFQSIRACARHHGIPMTTLRYRAKGKTQRPAWLAQ